MKKLVKLLFLLICVTSLFAEDFSEMSTQELIAIMGYVKPDNFKKFKKELGNRVKTMTPKEKSKYKKNLPKMKK